MSVSLPRTVANDEVRDTGESVEIVVGNLEIVDWLLAKEDGGNPNCEVDEDTVRS